MTFSVGDRIIDENGNFGTVELIHPTAYRPVLVYIETKEKWRAFMADGKRDPSDPNPLIAVVNSGSVQQAAMPNLSTGYGAPPTATLTKRRGITKEDLGKYFGDVAMSNAYDDKCICDSKVIHNFGCKCGYFQREKQRKGGS